MTQPVPDNESYSGPVRFIFDSRIVKWGRGDGRESIAKSLEMTNGFTQDARDAAQTAAKRPIPYNVVRRKSTGVDYLFGPGRFRAIASPDDYHFLFSGQLIAIEHGAAFEAEDNLLAFIRKECKATAAVPDAIEEVSPPLVL